MFINSKKDVSFRRIGARLKQICRSQNKKQADVAKAIDMDSYGNYEHGSEEISLWRVAQLCEYFGVSMGEVLNDCSPGLVRTWKEYQVKPEAAGGDADLYADLLLQVCDECVNMPAENLRAVLTMARALNGKKES